MLLQAILIKFNGKQQKAGRKHLLRGGLNGREKGIIIREANCENINKVLCMHACAYVCVCM